MADERGGRLYGFSEAFLGQIFQNKSQQQFGSSYSKVQSRTIYFITNGINWSEIKIERTNERWKKTKT